ncbi:MAG TPA: class F sortase [Pseudonocardia sp.]|uniref:class F sortase n=1 Tax=Pseudonocardia sp. TaxID=60912 RepID=UPI002ED96C3E
MIEARWALLWVILVLGLGIGGLSTARLIHGTGLPDVGPVPAAHPEWLGAAPPAAEPATPAAPATPAEPIWLSLPGQGIEAPVVSVGLETNGELAVPEDPRVLGWWRGGAHPSAGRGTVVIDGHVDARGIGAGALFRLADLKPGATVSVTTTEGSRSYLVDAVHSYQKTALPREIFDTTGVPRLVLITCGGEFDFETHQYADNVVAYAVPVEPDSSGDAARRASGQPGNGQVRLPG